MHLRKLELLGFLRRVAAYPVVFQVTNSATRHLERDSGSRRRHLLVTVQARFLAVDFYLAAHKWPTEFILDHEQKIVTFTDNGCPEAVLPQCGGRPYLREQIVRNDWLLDAKRLLELANKAYFLYLTRKSAEQAQLLRMMLLNCAIDGTSLYPTYREPFDLIFERAKNEEWSGRPDLNWRPLAPQASALPG